MTSSTSPAEQPAASSRSPPQSAASDQRQADGLARTNQTGQTDTMAHAPAAHEESSDGNAPSPSQEKPLEHVPTIQESMGLPREIMFVGIVCTAQLYTQAGIGQTISIIHIIGDSFKISDPLRLPWIIAGFSLTVGTFIVFSGRLGDLYGYKRLLMIGFTWYTVWSLISGFAVWSNFVLFVFTRVLAGIGPAIMLPNALAILGASYRPGMRKAMVFSIFAATAPAGVVGGAAFAGIWNLLWWPWTFWTFGIAMAITIGFVQIFVPDPPPKVENKDHLSFTGHLLELDILGAALGVLGLVLFNFAWNQAPISGWGSATCIVTLILGVAMMVAFFWVEARWAPSPLLPLKSLTYDHAFIIFAMIGGWASFGIWFYYTWQFVLELKGASPLLAAAYFSPCILSGAMASIVTGFIEHKIGPAILMVIAMVAFLVGNILIAVCPVDQIYWGQLFVAMLIMPWGMDMSFPAATLVLSNSLPIDEQGVAASLINTVVNYSISIGLGFAGTVEVNVQDGSVEKGYRGAQYTAIGFAALGLGISTVRLYLQYQQRGFNVTKPKREWPAVEAEV